MSDPVKKLSKVWYHKRTFFRPKGISLKRSPIIVSTNDPSTKNPYVNMVKQKPRKVMGGKPFLVLLVIIHRNKNGSMVCDIRNTQEIPMIEMAAIDRSAGC